MKKNEKIIKKLEGESDDEIADAMLSSFGFEYITDFGVRPDGSLLIEEALDRDYSAGALWVDWKNKRVCFYTDGVDLTMIEGELTKEEEKLWYNE
jgi:hypothetical protein